MVSEEKMNEEIDKATEAITIYHMIDLYVLLLKLKYTNNFQKEIEKELKWTELKLKVFNVDIEQLKDLYERKKQKLFE